MKAMLEKIPDRVLFRLGLELDFSGPMEIWSTRALSNTRARV
jgi:hypothetical protein